MTPYFRITDIRAGNPKSAILLGGKPSLLFPIGWRIVVHTGWGIGSIKKRGFWGQTNPANLLTYVYSIGGQKVTFSAFSFTYLYRTVEGLALNGDLKEKVHKFGFSMPKKIVRESGKDWKAIYTLISDNGTRKPVEFSVMVKR